MIAAAMELAAGGDALRRRRAAADVARKLELLKLSLTLPAPADPAKSEELTRSPPA